MYIHAIFIKSAWLSGQKGAAVAAAF